MNDRSARVALDERGDNTVHPCPVGDREPQATRQTGQAVLGAMGLDPLREALARG